MVICLLELLLLRYFRHFTFPSSNSPHPGFIFVSPQMNSLLHSPFYTRSKLSRQESHHNIATVVPSTINYYFNTLNLEEPIYIPLTDESSTTPQASLHHCDVIFYTDSEITNEQLLNLYRRSTIDDANSVHIMMIVHSNSNSIATRLEYIDHYNSCKYTDNISSLLNIDDVLRLNQPKFYKLFNSSTIHAFDTNGKLLR